MSSHVDAARKEAGDGGSRLEQMRVQLAETEQVSRAPDILRGEQGGSENTSRFVSRKPIPLLAECVARTQRQREMSELQRRMREDFRREKEQLQEQHHRSMVYKQEVFRAFCCKRFLGASV